MPPVFDRFDQGDGLWLRLGAKFLRERARQDLVLAQRGGWLPCLGIELHQLDVGRLVPRVERHQPPRVFDSSLVLAPRAVPVDQHLQGIGQRLAQAL